MFSVKCLLLVLAVYVSLVNCDSFQRCFELDSISCLQIQVYRTMRKLTERSSIQLVPGLTINKKHERTGKDLQNEDIEENLLAASNFATRQALVERFLREEIADLWSNSTLSWNAPRTVKTLFTIISNAVREKIGWNAGEDRSMKKKWKMIVPIALGLKAKFLAFLGFASFVVVAIAKKAFVAGVVSLCISTYLGLKDLLPQYKTFYYVPTTSSNHGFESYSPQAYLVQSTNQYHHQPLGHHHYNMLGDNYESRFQAEAEEQAVGE